MIDCALRIAELSPCRSRRGVVIYDPRTGAFRGGGHNGPPTGAACPGRAICAGTCSQRSVHAEIRALRAAAVHGRLGHPPGSCDLVHVELDQGGSLVACAGPSCWQCSREILDVGFVAGVWLYERAGTQRCGVYIGDNDATCPQLTCLRWRDHAGGHDNVTDDPAPDPAWHYYLTEDFYHVTLRNEGLDPGDSVIRMQRARE